MPEHRTVPRVRPKNETVSVDPAPSIYAFAPLLLLLAGSGCAALIYEIVWFQLLQLVIGSSAVSLGLLLAFYMGGLCLGSAVFPRLVSTRIDPKRVYALLELGIGAFGILALFGVPLIGRLYLLGPTNGLTGFIFRGVIAALCLLPPTLLMGCTFPAVSRWAGEAHGTSPEGGQVSRLGLLYSANTCGAVAGCVLAGFYLLRVYDAGLATYVAASINVAVALIAYWLPAKPGTRAVGLSSEPPQRAPGVLWIYVSIGLSGLAALGAEVVWTRLLSLLLGATVYTFSIILAVFLVGLWAGSSVGSILIRTLKEPRLALAACQLLILLACAWTAYTVARSLPYWPIDPLISINPWMNFELDMLRCAFAILPAALLWGASFPLALLCAAGEREDPGRLTGEVYAVNTAGAIVGALLFSLVMIPSAGTAGSERVLVWLAALSAVAALMPLLHGSNGMRQFAVGSAAALLLALVFGSTIPEPPWQMLAFGRRVAPYIRAAYTGTEEKATAPLYVGEGINSSVVISQRGEDRVFSVSGKVEASSELLDMRLQRMMGHLPALIHPNPRSVLIVGFGAGVTAGSFVPYPDVQKISICELEPLIPPASDQYFGKQNNNVLHDGRTSVIYDDARHYILTAPDKFDVITTDPIHPWVKGTSALYSTEYYHLVKSHLNPGGVAAQWLPLYETDEETVKTQLATFFDAFPRASVWSTYLNGVGYDLVLLGRPEESAIDVDAIDRRLKTPAYAGVAASLAEANFSSVTDLLGTYSGRAADLQPMLAGAQINDDLSMRLQYLAGLGLNAPESARIYKEILSYRKFPEDLLTGTGTRIEALRELLQRAPRTF